ncbi:F-box protein At1g49990-like [Camellia sinensis]|uniref:F-box protein At1g49990-like n=1 Tax=Camellia sinensis TaxID=4442 RepID=UPI001035BC87|nr:F-box protein At1g49990-like [Camellia sinensis]
MQSPQSSCGSNGGDSSRDDGTSGDFCRELTPCRLPSPIKVSSRNPQSDEQVVDVDHSQLGLPHLHDSLIQEIVLRLPVKWVFRFKAVSPNWLSRISEPSFSQLYVSRKINFRILYRYVYVSHFRQILERLDPESPDVYPSENFSVLFLSTHQEHLQRRKLFKILATSKGLLLSCLVAPLTYYMCDPVTTQWVTLPKPPDGGLNLHPFFIGEGLIAFANQDNMVTSYKVVRVEWHPVESVYLNFEVFSSETPFDPYNFEECRLIDLPNYRDIESENQYDGSYRLCEECQGMLRYFEAAPDITEDICFSMWIMRDYKKGEWNLVHRATHDEIWSDDPQISSYLFHVHFIPLAYHPFNLDIVYLRCEERSCIVAYNIKTKRLEVSCNPVGIDENLSWRVVIPFVLPMWPTPLPKRVRRGVKRSRSSNASSTC